MKDLDQIIDECQRDTPAASKFARLVFEDSSVMVWIVRQFDHGFVRPGRTALLPPCTCSQNNYTGCAQCSVMP